MSVLLDGLIIEVDTCSQNQQQLVIIIEFPAALAIGQPD